MISKAMSFPKRLSSFLFHPPTYSQVIPPWLVRRYRSADVDGGLTFRVETNVFRVGERTHRWSRCRLNKENPTSQAPYRVTNSIKKLSCHCCLYVIATTITAHRRGRPLTIISTLDNCSGHYSRTPTVSCLVPGGAESGGYIVTVAVVAVVYAAPSVDGAAVAGALTFSHTGSLAGAKSSASFNDGIVAGPQSYATQKGAVEKKAHVYCAYWCCCYYSGDTLSCRYTVLLAAHRLPTTGPNGRRSGFEWLVFVSIFLPPGLLTCLPIHCWPIACSDLQICIDCYVW